jgi:hypothetical protein
MYTYDVVTESAHNPELFAAELSKRSADGWELVQIVYTGERWLHAFVRKQGIVPTALSPGHVGETVTTPVQASTPASTVSSPGASSSSQDAPEVPANWYKDPSGRFELRYWSGSQWTEHVSTAGKQSTDPPRA